MLSEASSDTTLAAPHVLTPKNVHRLNRIFRKPKAALAKRSWHPTTASSVNRRVGVPPEEVMKLVVSLTAEEKIRAAAKQDPLTAMESELSKRAARFGVTIQTGPVAVVVDAETLQRRQAKFGTAITPGVSSTTIPVTVQLSEEDKAAMEARARRFAR